MREVVGAQPPAVKWVQTTVEPPNRGHFGTAAFVLPSEVVLFSEVV